MILYPNSMRLRFVLFLILGLSYFHSFAQKTERKLTLDYEQEDIFEVIRDIENKTQLNFYYLSAELVDKKVTAKVEDKNIDEALTIVFQSVKVNFYSYNNNVFLSTKANFHSLMDIEANTSFENNLDTTINLENYQVASLLSKQYIVGLKSEKELKNKVVVLSGFLLDFNTKAPLSDINVSVYGSKNFSISDSKGYFSLSLPIGNHTLIIKGIKNIDTKRSIALNGDGVLVIELKEQAIALKQVTVNTNRLSPTRSLEMGVNRLDIKTIKQVPSVFGEPDILRVVLTLPGVQSVGEASTGFNVRGGAADQNLIMLNDATIYNPSHFFGFFSAFNPDLVKDIELYKSTIPERFGGRLSSVLEVNNREGDKKKLRGSAGIGVITSRFNIEGPIDSGRTSVIAGGRATYSNWLLKLLPDQYKNSRAGFYDLNLGISHSFNENNDIHFSGYYSRDNFRLSSDTTYNYSNKNLGVKWRRKFSDKVIGVFKINTDFYNYNIESDVNPINAYKLNFNINQNSLKTDFIHRFNDKHEFNYGASATYYRLMPGNNGPLNQLSLVKSDEIETEQALENAIYFGDKFEVTDKLALNLGLRYSIYSFLGPKNVNIYQEEVPRTTTNLIETKTYGKGSIIKTFHGPEFRFSTKYSFNSDFSVKAAFNTLRQYLHLLSNTTAIAPTDIWKLSDPNIKPQNGSQISLGLYKTFASQSIETSIEVYHKTIRDYLDYKSGATLVLNHHIETDVVSTKGKAYGMEFFLKKNTGKLNGWMSYTYSRTFLKMDDPNNGPLINGGRFYPANYDKPHAINFTGNYKFKQRYHLSINATYSTGRPITVPVARYSYAGSERVYYSDRNAFRIPDYFRTDISFNIEGNHKLKQLLHNSWTFGVYNLTGRKNAYSTYFVQENGVINGYRLSIFASAIPFVNYNIRF